MTWNWKEASSEHLLDISLPCLFLGETLGVPGAGSPCSPLFSTLFLLVRITTTIDLSYNHSNLHEICNVYVFMFSDICSENFFMYSQDKLPSLVQLSPSVFHYSSPHEMHFYFYQSITIYSYQLGIHSTSRCNHGVKECIFSKGYLAIHIRREIKKTYENFDICPN